MDSRTVEAMQQSLVREFQESYLIIQSYVLFNNGETVLYSLAKKFQVTYQVMYQLTC